MYDFSVDYDAVDRSNILNIHKYLMIKKVYKILGIVKKMFVLSSSTVNASNHTKYALLSNQKCEIQPTLINLHPNEYSQVSHYYPFAVELDRCDGSCNTLKDLSNKAFLPHKT